jgi:hypothetical protein
MDEDLKQLRDALVRRHLGKHGIHGLSVDENSRTLEVYVDDAADPDRAVARLRKDAGDLTIRTIKSRRARLV